MCTFKDEQTVQVCDVAIGRVRERLQEVFGDTVQYTTVNGQGTLVQAPSTVDSAQFQSVTPAWNVVHSKGHLSMGAVTPVPVLNRNEEVAAAFLIARAIS